MDLPLSKLKWHNMKKIILGGKVKIEDVLNVSRFNYVIEFSKEYIDRVERCRKFVDEFSKQRKAIYGITTGLGDNYTKFINESDRETIQRNNILSHTCSVGEPLNKECVRSMMFVMLVHFGTGHTGIKIETLNLIKDLLNNEITPFVPRHGSVGYLCLEAHIGEVLIGEGKAWYKDELKTSIEILNEKDLKPIILSSKEGLTIVSGTTSVTAISTLALYDAITLAKTSDISGSLSLEVLKGTLMAMDDRLMQVRPHIDQGNTAENIRNILCDSEIIEKYKGHRVQDALSLRSMPQLHGASKKIIKDCLETIEIELNSSVDNPLIFEVENNEAIALMGCNADGSYVGMAADTLAIAVTNICKMSERRIDRLVNRHLSDLPAFLNKEAGLNNGLMIVQYSAAGLLGEMRIAAHPASIDNVPTCANQEDFVSMGYNAAMKAYECVSLSKYIIAIELICGAQALDFYNDLKPSKATNSVYDLIRQYVPSIENDINMHPCIESVAELVKTEKIVESVENIIGELKF